MEVSLEDVPYTARKGRSYILNGAKNDGILHRSCAWKGAGTVDRKLEG